MITQTDLSFIGNGSRVISCSDGDASCLIYPGTGQSCDDGWETRRSRLANHADWAVIRLGCPGKVEWAEIDTKLCKGKQPKHAGLFGCFSNEVQQVSLNVRLGCNRKTRKPILKLLGIQSWKNKQSKGIWTIDLN